MKKTLLFYLLITMLLACRQQNSALVKQMELQQTQLEAGISSFEHTGASIDSLLNVASQAAPGIKSNPQYVSLFEKINGQHNKYVATMATAQDMLRKNSKLAEDYQTGQIRQSEALLEANVIGENINGLLLIFDKIKTRLGGLKAEYQSLQEMEH
ncbi:MAG: hypothetical protein KGS48_10170 [Bacteroidetes bacterium]|nr:hypothetical protein [Bacteroidota bacterium]